MELVKDGDRVEIICEIKLEDGELCYKNDLESPIEFTIGEGNFFPKIESLLIDMQEGESKIITLEPEDAFGPYADDLIIDAPKDLFQTEVEIDVGSKLKIKAPSGKSYYAVVTGIDEDTFKLNLNHPLAGKKIVVNITLQSIIEDKPETKKKSLFSLSNSGKKPKKKIIKKTTNPSKTK
jgi:FKBP-type peptidyl-prolyl cis-trans isomerase 2